MKTNKLQTPICAKCGGAAFEMQEIKVKNAEFRHSVINCSSCGAIVSVSELFNINIRLEKLAQKLGVNFFE